MNTITNQRVRLMVDASQAGGINDVATGGTPQFWNGADVQFELGIFYGNSLAAVDNLASITVDIKREDPRTGVPLMSQTIAATALNNGLTLAAWNGGATADCHAAVKFSSANNQFIFPDASANYWLVISALTTDSPAHKIVLGATPVTVMESGFGTVASAAVATPSFYTSAQSDARFQRALILTAPLSGNAAGTPGALATEGSYLYVCTAVNIWKRVALTAF